MITTTGLKTAIYVNDIFQSPTGCEIITTTTGFEAVDATNATAGKAMRTNRKRRGIRERYHLREMPRKQECNWDHRKKELQNQFDQSS
jgi:hypothetical protein